MNDRRADRKTPPGPVPVHVHRVRPTPFSASVQAPVPNIPLHSGPGPDRWLYPDEHTARREEEKAKNWSRSPKKQTVLFGLGLGYRAAALQKHAPAGHTLFVVEENSDMIRQARQNHDFSLAEKCSNLVMVPFDRDFLEKLALALARPYRRGESDLIVDEHCRAYFTPAFSQAIERFRQTLQKTALDQAARIRHSADLIKNEMINLPLTLLARAVDGLADILPGTPAIVVSAGPSLNQNLALLAKAVGRAVIIATAPVLRVLSAHNIVPDLVGVLDYTPGNHEVLSEAYASEDVPLVFMEGVYPDVIRDYQGELVSVLDEDGPVRKWLARSLAGHSSWPVRDNVGLFCVDIALHLGADPIIMVGQDLAFPDLSVHAAGVIGPGRLASNRHIPYPVQVDAVQGGKVISNLTFAAYLEGFNQTLARNPDRTFINTSRHGARIEGTRELSLAEALDTCPLPTRPIKAGIREGLRHSEYNHSSLSGEMSRLEEELKNLETIAAKGMEINGDITGLLAGPAGSPNNDVLRLLAVHDQYYTGAETYCRSIEPLARYLTATMMDGAGSKACLPERPDQANIKVYLDTTLAMMTDIREGAALLLSILGKSARQYRRVVEPSTDGDAPSLHLEAARAWADLGRLQPAWNHYRQVLTLGPSHDAVLEAALNLLGRERPGSAEQLVLRHFGHASASGKAGSVLEQIRETVTGWLKRGQHLYQQGDLVGALLLSRKVLAARPNDGVASHLEKDCRDRIEAGFKAEGEASVSETMPADCWSTTLSNADTEAITFKEQGQTQP